MADTTIAHTPGVNHPLDDVATHSTLDSLPNQVLVKILSCCEAREALAAGLASHSLYPLLREAEVSLDMGTGVAGDTSPAMEHLSCTLQQLACTFPGLTSINLSNQPVEDRQVQQLLLSFAKLHSLDLAGCKKLTASITDLLVDHSKHTNRGPESKAHGHQLQLRVDTLSLQRCFQMKSSTLTSIARAAVTGALPLRCLAMSHLDLEQWPPTNTAAAAAGAAAIAAAQWQQQQQDAPDQGLEASTSIGASIPFVHALAACLSLPATTTASEREGRDQDDNTTHALPASVAGPAAPAAAAGGAVPRFRPADLGTQLQLLALNNCSRITSTGLQAVAALCPNLQYLMLGGSILTVGSHWRDGSVHPGASADDAAAAAEASPPPSSSPRIDLLPAFARALPRAHAAASLFAAQQPSTVVVTAASARIPLLQRLRQHQERQQLQQDAAAAAELAAAALCMPRLRALELTFMPRTVVACTRAVLEACCDCVDDDGAGSGGSSAPRVLVWDLTQEAGIDSALAARSAVRRYAGGSTRAHTSSNASPGATSAATAAAAAAAGPCPAQMDLALRCAVNCSSVTRNTPLHAAVERADAGSVTKVLSLGCQVDARDKGGATALFHACEAGHAACVEALLAGGADGRLGNAAGESPLYIAALRGHLRAMGLLIEHFDARGVAWQEPKLYTDCWTPLMAAAVADRFDVAQALLAAAGPQGALDLMGAINRYGQSVMHIAARKCSRELLQLLLAYGGRASVGAADTCGETPLDVAKKNRHAVALAEFRRAVSSA